MSSRIDPTRVWRRRTLLTWAIALPTVIAAAWWAFTPPPPYHHLVSRSIDTDVLAGSEHLNQDHDPKDATVAQLDLDAFDVELWPATDLARAEDTAATHPATRAPKPLTLQLIGIVSEPTLGGETPIRKAALYDPDTDRILIVASGERVGDHTITSIKPRSVVLAANDSSHTLRLRPDLPPPLAPHLPHTPPRNSSHSLPHSTIAP